MYFLYRLPVHVILHIQTKKTLLKPIKELVHYAKYSVNSTISFKCHNNF